MFGFVKHRDSLRFIIFAAELALFFNLRRHFETQNFDLNCQNLWVKASWEAKIGIIFVRIGVLQITSVADYGLAKRATLCFSEGAPTQDFYVIF
jgi:hypothetical protein